MLTKVLKLFFQNKILLLLLTLGTISWSLVMVKSGVIYDYGMGFWGPNGHDGIWHIALANSLSQGSLEMPIFAGEKITNYHIGFDAILAFLTVETGISPINIYFQVLPPLFALLIGILVYKLVITYGNRESGLWAVFFTYFGGSFGWILTLVKDGQLGGESAFWAQQAISTLINPPYALSLIFLLAGFLTFQKYVKKNDLRFFVLTAILWGTVIEIKAYAGVLILASLFVGAVWHFLYQKSARLFLLLATTLLISLVVFVPLNSKASGLIVYQPFWFLETMMILTDRVGWVKFGEAMMNYKSGGVIYKSIPAYIIAFIVFWFGNLGTRAIKELYLFRKISKIKTLSLVEVMMVSMIIIGLIIPMIFLQKGTPWNTIQFLYYSLFFSGIFAAFALKKTSIIVTAVIILLTIPTSIATLWYVYLPSRPPSKISTEELSALKFLESQPPGIVFSYPFDDSKANGEVPRPLYRYVSTAYITALSKKPSYMEDEMNLDITGYDWKNRKEKALAFLNSLSETEVREFLKNNNIKYIYWIKGQRAKLGETQLGLIRLFENKEVDIYLVQ